MASVEERVKKIIVERKINLETDVPDDLPFVRADKDRFTQVIINLLSNAVKFTDSETGRIWLRARAAGDYLEVSVRDNGPGIPTEWQDRIFERFIQMRKRDDAKPHGTGLGLPICKQIIEFFGGRIWVTSRSPGALACRCNMMPSSVPRRKRRRLGAGAPERSSVNSRRGGEVNVTTASVAVTPRPLPARMSHGTPAQRHESISKRAAMYVSVCECGSTPSTSL